MPSKDTSLASRCAGTLRVNCEERSGSCRCAASCMPVSLQCIHGTCATCRWEKSSAEAGLMQASAAATAAAMTECMQLTRPGVQEHQLAAVFGEHQLANLPFACLQLQCWCNLQPPLWHVRYTLLHSQQQVMRDRLGHSDKVERKAKRIDKKKCRISIGLCLE